MDFTGLYSKHRVDRPLTEQETEAQLKQHERLAVTPTDYFDVIAKTDAYLEIVDKYYAIRGIFPPYGIAALVLTFFVCAVGGIAPLIGINFSSEPVPAWFIISVLAITLPPLALFVYLLLKELFTYTHWPVRFDRRNQRVYVFRHNGPDGVLDLAWDEVFFTIGRPDSGASRYIRGHALDDNGRVQATFDIAHEWSEEVVDEFLKPQWEYIRRFMDEGAAAIPEPEDGYLPIADKRETIFYSFYKSFQLIAYNWIMIILLSPFSLAFGVGRILSIKTSKVPRWPEYVKKACGDT